jgi:hypothetical protein
MTHAEPHWREDLNWCAVQGLKPRPSLIIMERSGGSVKNGQLARWQLTWFRRRRKMEWIEFKPEESPEKCVCKNFSVLLC